MPIFTSEPIREQRLAAMRSTKRAVGNLRLTRPILIGATRVMARIGTRRSSLVQLTRHRERMNGEARAVSDADACEDSLQVRPDSGACHGAFAGNLLVRFAPQHTRHNMGLLGWQADLCHHRGPDRRIDSGREFVRKVSAGPHGVSQKKSVEPETLREPPPRGMGNAPWPTPLSGRGYQGAAFPFKLGGFPEAAQ